MTRWGDWTDVDGARFAGGLGAVAAGVRGRGMVTGLWVAPWAADKGSAVVRDHPDWVLRGRDGRPANSGYTHPGEPAAADDDAVYGNTVNDRGARAPPLPPLGPSRDTGANSCSSD